MPQPRAGEIVMRVRATALNRGEIVVGGAVHGGPEKIGGTEAAGEVHAVGAGITKARVGDRIFGRVRGGFAEYVAMEEAQIIPMPPRLTFEQAAAVPISYITAYEMLYAPYGKLKAREWLLITGASAGAGVASIQIAKMIGAKPSARRAPPTRSRSSKRSDSMSPSLHAALTLRPRSKKRRAGMASISRSTWWADRSLLNACALWPVMDGSQWSATSMACTKQNSICPPCM